MPQLSTREYRSIIPMSIETKAEKRFETDYYAEGYATTYEPYVLWEDEDGPVYEEFRRGCFDNTDMSDIIMQYDHRGKVFARNRNNTLIVEADMNGLFVAADLSKSEASRSMYEEIDNGLVDRMSWGFIPGEYYYDAARRTFVHTSVKKIFDVSAVSIPANDNTNISARSTLVNGEIERVRKEFAERAKKKLLLKITLEEKGEFKHE